MSGQRNLISVLSSGNTLRSTTFQSSASVASHLRSNLVPGSVSQCEVSSRFFLYGANKNCSSGCGGANGNGTAEGANGTAAPPAHFRADGDRDSDGDKDAELLGNMCKEGNNEVTVKLFLPEGVDSAAAADAASAALELLHAFSTQIKYFILSFGGVTFSDDDDEDSDDEDADPKFKLTQAQVYDVWTAATRAARELDAGGAAASVAHFGVSDFSKTRLERLVSRIEEEKGAGVAPVAINHINATDCCALPPSLVAYTKEHGVTLLAHHDEPAASLVDEGELTDIVNMLKIPRCPSIKVAKWRWVLKLTVVEKDRQILVGNEYLVAL